METVNKDTLLRAERLGFKYNEKPLLRQISFRLNEGEIIAIAGESGSGKTTLLKLLGGLLKPESGKVWLRNEQIKNPEEKLIPGHDTIKLVSQDFDLMPYLSVDDNILRESLSKNQSSRKKLLGQYHKKLKLKGVENSKATHTSGGQKQRVAMATALATSPEVLLLDEPFSNMDYSLKKELIHLLRTIWKPLGMIIVTHEPTDLLNIADSILVMKKGKIEQRGTPEELYYSPKNKYVAELFGSITQISPEQATSFSIKTAKSILVRPNEFKLSNKGVTFEIVDKEFMGAYSVLYGYNKLMDLTILLQLGEEMEIGEEVRVMIEKRK